MDFTEPADDHTADWMRAEHRALVMVEILADTAWRRHLWQSLVTQLIREKAALQLSNERLREELRRYTSAQVRG